MDEPCKACSSGPFGFAGHADLTVQTLGDAQLTLRCARCQQFWVRTPVPGGGRFAWDAITNRMACSPQMGIAVPRSTEFRPLPWRGGGDSPWLVALTGRSYGSSRDPVPPAVPWAN